MARRAKASYPDSMVTISMPTRKIVDWLDNPESTMWLQMMHNEIGAVLEKRMGKKRRVRGKAKGA